MKQEENRSLSELCSMQTGGAAALFFDCTTIVELKSAIETAKEKGLPIWIIGGGSNTVFVADFLEKAIIRYSASNISFTNTDNGVTVTADAGVQWDDLVAQTVHRGLSGIELMSLIPGDCGAAPIQNIGAYGQQLSDSLQSVTVLDIESGATQTVHARDLGLVYRGSRLKNTDRKELVILSITLLLSNELTASRPLYKDIEVYLEENDLQQDITPKSLREAVISIRTAKLPDPATTPNSGSFFKNPVISAEQKEALIKKYPELDPWVSKIFGKKSQGFWQNPDGSYKVAAGMLMEHAGFADYTDAETGFGTWPTQALCVINKHGGSGPDLLKFIETVTSKINTMHSIQLEIEPELIK